MNERRERELREALGGQSVEPPVSGLEELPDPRRSSQRPPRRPVADDVETAGGPVTDSARAGPPALIVEGVSTGSPAQLSGEAPTRAGRGPARGAP